MERNGSFTISNMFEECVREQDYKKMRTVFVIILYNKHVMEYNRFLEQRHSKRSIHDILYVAYRNFVDGVNRYFDNQIKMAELKVAWIIAYVVGIPLYIFAAATNFDTWKAVVLFTIAAFAGLLHLGRLSVKFFKELLTVLVEYREKKINIEGVKWLYVAIGLLGVIVILAVICLFLIFK